MTKRLTIKRPFHVCKRRRGRKAVAAGRAVDTSSYRVPRIAHLMALAIRFDQLLHDGVVKDQAEMARLGHVSRARLTQIMNLLSLAPDIQEELLSLAEASLERTRITERHLRPLAAVGKWEAQRCAWKKLMRNGCQITAMP